MTYANECVARCAGAEVVSQMECLGVDVGGHMATAPSQAFPLSLVWVQLSFLVFFLKRPFSVINFDFFCNFIYYDI